MKLLFDTSILVAALVEAHPHHSRAFPWYKRASTGDVKMYISNHTILELYSTLTSLPISPRILPGVAERVIKESILEIAQIVAYTKHDYCRLISNLSHIGISGGAVYDALIASAAKKAKIKKIITLNFSDFARFWPEENIVTA